MLVQKKKISYSLLLEDESPTSDLHFIGATSRRVEANADSSKQPGRNSPQKAVRKRWKRKLKQHVPLPVNGDEKSLVSPKAQRFCLVEYSKPIESPVSCFDNIEESLSTVKFSESNTNPDQSSTSWNRRIIKRQKKQKANRDFFGNNEDDDSEDDIFYLRRHTIADMTVAAYGMVICGTDDMHQRYRGRIEKVKFGVPIAEAFSHDIPATLLVLLLKVNKEGPLKKDIWRAPGNQAQVRKLSHIMQHGRLVNISNISVYTAASVIKKFLSKLPGGIFGSENEQELFTIVQQADSEQQRQVFCRVICSLSVPSQHLLVLLFGTFRIISDSADTFGTRMTPDAIGISVAPSLFHTCIHDGQRAKLEDVMRFKLASQVISKIIQGFGFTNLFPRECYEFYARITGRTLRVDEHWHFTFQYPSNSSKRDFSSMISDLTAACAAVARSYSLEALENDRQTTPATLKNVRRGGSLKTPTTIVRPTKNRHSISPNQVFSVGVGEESEGEDKPPSTAPPPPPIEEDELAFEASPETLPRHLNILRAIDDLDLRESASCNF
uniref:Rho-GAP domain-containing protein n=1 Tax=Panagrolaimus sp. JU765 TaxID=591449 RepID=A0AC34QBM8_9BILA